MEEGVKYSLIIIAIVAVVAFAIMFSGQRGAVGETVVGEAMRTGGGSVGIICNPQKNIVSYGEEKKSFPCGNPTFSAIVKFFRNGGLSQGKIFSMINGGSNELIRYVFGYYEIYYTNDNTFTGDLSDLKTATLLQHIYFSQVSVGGDISNLGGLNNLNYIGFYMTDVTGDISSLSNLNNLGFLSLAENDVYGDIASLGNLNNFNELWLFNTDVSGQINSLTNLGTLGALSLYNTDVSGDISSLRNLNELSLIMLHDTGVTGDIEDLNGKDYSTLHLGNSDVFYTSKTKSEPSASNYWLNVEADAFLDESFDSEADWLYFCENIDDNTWSQIQTKCSQLPKGCYRSVPATMSHCQS
jgi:hypothetical protein